MLQGLPNELLTLFCALMPFYVKNRLMPPRHSKLRQEPPPPSPIPQILSSPKFLGVYAHNDHVLSRVKNDMGCVSSGVRVANKPKNPSDMFMNVLDDQGPIPQMIDELVQSDVKTMISAGAGSTPVPDPVAPVVLLNENAMPVTIGVFRAGDKELNLPIVAISRCDKGRLALLGSVSLLDSVFIENNHTFALIESLLNWGTGFSADSSKILVVGFPKAITDTLQVVMQTTGYAFDVRDTLPEVATHSAMLISSDFRGYDVSTFVDEMIEMDNCVMVFAVPYTSERAFYSNEYTRKYGLAFSVCGMTPLSSSLKVHDVSELKGYSLETLKDDYLRIALRIDFRSEEERCHELSAAISQLRYYIRELPSGSEPAFEIMMVSYDSLREIGIESDDKFCPRPLQRLLCYVLMEAMEHVDPQLVPELSHLEKFPGVYDRRGVSDYSMKLSLHPDVWNATGMWLPPGVKGSVCVDSPTIVKVGSHITPLALDADDWQRWPIVTMTYYVDADCETQIATPVGGIIYFICDSTKSVHVKFRGVIRYPFWHQTKTKVWEDTRNSVIPWAEAYGKTVTFTLPTKNLIEIPDISEFHQFYEKALVLVSRFVGIKHFPQTRIVFDPAVKVETFQRSEANFIIAPLANVSAITDINTPSDAMHRLLTCCCNSLISESFFDESIESTIASVAAAYAIATKMGNNTIMNRFSGADPDLYNDLKGIALESGFSQIATAMTALMSNPSVTNSHTACSLFMKSLSDQMKSPISGLLGHVRAIGAVTEDSSPKLTEYEVKDSQI